MPSHAAMGPACCLLQIPLSPREFYLNASRNGEITIFQGNLLWKCYFPSKSSASALVGPREKLASALCLPLPVLPQEAGS